MSAHTPGPWRVDRSGALLGVNVVAPTDWICKVGLSDRPNVMEDARLIAAAPFMYELIMDAIEDETEFETEWDRLARALIAQVNGESA
jgi:hypothetical protein